MLKNKGGHIKYQFQAHQTCKNSAFALCLDMVQFITSSISYLHNTANSNAVHTKFQIIVLMRVLLIKGNVFSQ